MDIGTVLIAAFAALPPTIASMSNHRNVKKMKKEVTTANGGLSLADLLVKMEEASRAPIDKVTWRLYYKDHPLPATIIPEPVE